MELFAKIVNSSLLSLKASFQMLDKVLNTPVIMEVCLRSLQYLESLGSSVVFLGGGEGRRGLIFFYYTEAKAKRLNGSFSKMRLCLIIDYQLRQKLQVIQ